MGGGDVPGFRPFQYKYLYTILTPALKLLWKNAAFLVANSDGLRHMAHQVFPDVPVQVIPNGVDVRRFAAGQERIPDESVRILFVSRLIRRKGLQFLIDAVPLIRQYTPIPFVIKVIGDGPDKELFLKQIQDRGVQQYFKFVGYVEHDKLPEYYFDADVFVLPSLAEGMPNVVLEAMGSGLPVVATNVPGSAELVQHGENGFLIGVKDPNELAWALRRLIDDRLLRKKMGKQAQQTARNYSWTFVADQYLRLYTRTQQECL
jgi:glycosyltransferase involved in cell wall biosynthesis